MSYLMDFEDSAKITSDDMVVNYDEGNFSLVIDPKVQEGCVCQCSLSSLVLL